jgi:hypothetical protein
MSYRNYLKISLSQSDFAHMNASAPEGLKYCNFLCQCYLQKTEFTERKSGGVSMCKNCQNLLNLAIKQIEEKTIAIEDFIENPNIVLGQEYINISTKVCSDCKQKKGSNDFEYGRNRCKECRAIEATNRDSNIEAELADIENRKNNLAELEKYVKLIPKDKLIRCISHYKIGRKSTYTKAEMIKNVVLHFERFLNPNICRGSCGNVLKEQFTTCNGCMKIKNRLKPTIEEFKEKELPKFIEELKPITDENEWQFNREKLKFIGSELGIQIKQKLSKEEAIKEINEAIEKKIDEKKKSLDRALSKDDEYKIQLNGLMVSAREDGYINATQLCKAGGKLFGNWHKLDSTKELIKTLEDDFLEKSDILKITSQLIDVKKGNSGKFTQGTWIHPDLAVQLAQWISPKFAVQVSRWVREIALTGTVSIGKEKTNKELVELQQKFLEQEKTLKALENKHSKLLKKRNYYKFKKGSAFYIISDIESSCKKFKVGIDGEDINLRMAQHRSTMPACRLEFLCYTESNKIIEDGMLKRYEKYRKFLNHEWIYDIDINHIMNSVETFTNFLAIEMEVESSENIEKYNKDIESVNEEEIEV